jgi:hypothetical protein
LVADVIVGRLLAGNSLTITNENNTFTLDGTGATLTNANFLLNTSNGNTRIFLDPTNGIKIQANVGGTWTDKFYADSAGNIILDGKITATTGNIGGWSISSTGLSDSYGNYIRSTGYVKLGMLTMTPTTAVFSGNIYATNLVGQVSNSQISSLSADKITAGTIYGSTVSWAGGYLGTTGTGAPILKGYGNLTVQGNNSYLGLGTNSAYLYAGSGGTTQIESGAIKLYGTTTLYSPVYFTSTIFSRGYQGQTIGYSVETPYGTKVLTFTDGILTGYT